MTNPLATFYEQDLKWCTCGDPESVLHFMRDVLEAIDNRSKAWRSNRNATAEQTAILNVINYTAPLGLSYFYMLDANGLLEHGGSVTGSWLTPKGESILEMLQSADIDKVFED